MALQFPEELFTTTELGPQVQYGIVLQCASTVALSLIGPSTAMFRKEPYTAPTQSTRHNFPIYMLAREAFFVAIRD